MDKFLFLDVDGVLNHEEWYNRLHNMKKEDRPGFPISQFDPLCVDRVNKILDATGAKLIISSSWRTDKLLYDTFSKVGLHKIDGVTPYLYTYDEDTYESQEKSRGDEIKAFLKDKHYSSYCVLDDDEDMLDEQLPYFVKTIGESGDGLNDECMKKAIEILNR